MVLVTANWLASNGSQSTGSLSAQCAGNGGVISGISMGSGQSGSTTAMGMIYMPAGTHYCTGVATHTNQRTLGACSVLAFGAKR